jgi:hypothetical protein
VLASSRMPILRRCSRICSGSPTTLGLVHWSGPHPLPRLLLGIAPPLAEIGTVSLNKPYRYSMAAKVAQATQWTGLALKDQAVSRSIHDQEFSLLQKVQTEPEAHKFTPHPKGAGAVSLGSKRPGPPASGQTQTVWSCVSTAHSSRRMATTVSILAEHSAAPHNAAISVTELSTVVLSQLSLLPCQCYCQWNARSFQRQWRTQEFYSGGGFNKFSWGQRERGSGSSGPLVRGSGGSCNLIQQISFHIVKFS